MPAGGVSTCLRLDGSALRRVRRRLGLDRPELARRLGMTESELLGLEKGTARLGIDQLCRLIGELGTDLPALAGETRRDGRDRFDPLAGSGSRGCWQSRPPKRDGS